MKRKILFAIILTLILALFVACDLQDALPGVTPDIPSNTTDVVTGHTHKWSEWKTTKEATCSAEGEQERSCSCGEKETQSIAAKGHTVLNGHCSVCGEMTYSKGLAFVSNGDGTCYISGMGTCTDTELYIPSVSPAGDIVTSIGPAAFRDCSSLTSITIPDSVTSIGSSAFFDCISLTYITIPDSVTSIGAAAFFNCSSLASVTIPNSVTSISLNTFYVCSSLTSITIPDSVTSIGYGAFYGCSSLTSVTIGNCVTSIGERAFENCIRLTSVTIPDSVTSIGRFAFRGCSSLTSVTIGNCVTSIGACAFENCSSLTSITFDGKIYEWKAISKGPGWNERTGNYTIYCTDGNITK